MEKGFVTMDYVEMAVVDGIFIFFWFTSFSPLHGYLFTAGDCPFCHSHALDRILDS